MGITLRPRAGGAHWAGPVAPCVAALCRRTGPRGGLDDALRCFLFCLPLPAHWGSGHVSILVRGGSTGRKRGIVGAQASLLRALPCPFPINMERGHDGPGITSPRRGPYGGGGDGGRIISRVCEARSDKEMGSDDASSTYLLSLLLCHQPVPATLALLKPYPPSSPQSGDLSALSSPRLASLLHVAPTRNI